MFHMGWFLTTGFGVYGWNDPWSGNVRADVGSPQLYIDTATALERAGFDYMMFEDSSVLPNIYQGTFESSVSAGQAIRFDPMPLMPLLAQATQHIAPAAPQRADGGRLAQLDVSIAASCSAWLVVISASITSSTASPDITLSSL